MMEKKVLALVLTAMMLSIAAAGCLGGGDPEPGTGTGTQPQMERKTGQITEEAWVAGGPATIEDVDVSTKVTFNIPDSHLVDVKFSIQIIDGHGNREHENENTRPDELKGEKIVGGGGGENATGEQSKPIPMGGQNAIIDFRAPEGSHLPRSWEIHLTVTIKASEDQWPGPLIWRGYPDEGFYYIIKVDYTYMSEL